MFEDMQEFSMCFSFSLLLGRYIYYSIKPVSWNVDLKIVGSERVRRMSKICIKMTHVFSMGPVNIAVDKCMRENRESVYFSSIYCWRGIEVAVTEDSSLLCNGFSFI